MPVRYHHEFTEDELEQMMYHWDDNATPVEEYHYMKEQWKTPGAVIGDGDLLAGKRSASRSSNIKQNAPKQDVLREHAVDVGHRTVVDLKKGAPESEEPVFLSLDTSDTAHVIEFYATWCPHCQHFKSEYIEVAREVTRRAIGTPIRFHAVSCQLYREVCRAYNIDGFPVVLGYAIGDSIEEVGWELNPEGKQMTPGLIAGPLSLTLAHESKDIQIRNFTNSDDRRSYQDELIKMGRQAARKKVERYEVPSDLIDRYHNAAASLAFILKTGVLIKHRDSLDDKRRLALRDFLGLVLWATPTEWHVRDMVDEILANLDQVAGNPGMLIEVVEQHQSLSIEGGLWGDIVATGKHPAKTRVQRTKSNHRINEANVELEQTQTIFWRNNRWTEACTHSETGMGFTCGLWDLLHIVSIGSSMPRGQVYGFQRGQLTSPRDVAEIMTRFIGNFFACDVCRWNFLDMYDRCGHDHCHRLAKTMPSLLAGEEAATTSRELAVWLWEVHNAVNVRLMKEDAERNNRHASAEEGIAAVFPTKHMCHDCWLDEGMTKFDKQAVYNFLEQWYWPPLKTGRPALQFAMLYPKSHIASRALSEIPPVHSYAILLVPVATLALISLLCRRFMQQASSINPRKNV